MAMWCSPIVCVLEKMHQKQLPECKPFLKGAGALTNVFALYTAAAFLFGNCMLIARHLEIGNKNTGSEPHQTNRFESQILCRTACGGFYPLFTCGRIVRGMYM